MAAKTPLSTEEVCRIIELSATAGVSELKFGDLHVHFGVPLERIPYPVQQYPLSTPVPDLTEAEHLQQTKESLAAEEVLTREDQLARALVEDPVRYEELLRDGELSDLDAADRADPDDE